MSKCALSNKHTQDGRPGRYENHRTQKEQKRTPPPPQTTRGEEPQKKKKAENSSIVASQPENAWEVQPANGCHRKLQNPHERPRKTLVNLLLISM